ncbi:uncharacterized protein [Henckelia pumila]|uniref:uncharacterized protein n=1 Tax=Henckelia pumila TaxID=405737 RepID=UPI003C6E2EA2
MDSGHSDSSSCGDDQEYDSRTAAAYSYSSFGNHHPQPPPFDPFSNFLQLQNSSPLNPNVYWPRSSSTTHHDIISSDSCPNSNIMTNFPFAVPPQPPTAVASAANLSDAPPASAAENRNPAAARNTKKRSRASRRAPTTVLTTDTSNFRAMVQEFTGIPAPPFTSSSPFQRSRFDLYGASSSMRLKPHDAAPPPYLHRPFAPEVPRTLFLATATASISSSSTSTPPMNYNPSLSSQNSNLFNLISNPSLASFLPTDHHKFPFTSSINNNLPSKIQPCFEIPTNIHVKSVSAGNLPNLIPSDQMQPRNGMDHLHHVGAETNNISRNPRNDDEKMNNYNLHENPSTENIGTRRSSEGMMESWICSSELK